MHREVQKIEFYRKIGGSGRIAIPKYFKKTLEGKIVKVIIEVLEEVGE